jgi:hypothetical protein
MEFRAGKKNVTARAPLSGRGCGKEKASGTIEAIRQRDRTWTRSHKVADSWNGTPRRGDSNVYVHGGFHEKMSGDGVEVSDACTAYIS